MFSTGGTCSSRTENQFGDVSCYSAAVQVMDELRLFICCSAHPMTSGSHRSPKRSISCCRVNIEFLSERKWTPRGGAVIRHSRFSLCTQTGGHVKTTCRSAHGARFRTTILSATPNHQTTDGSLHAEETAVWVWWLRPSRSATIRSAGLCVSC